jgi:hypothetical protein
MRRRLRADYRRRRVDETILRDGRIKTRVSTVRLHSLLRDYGPEVKAFATERGCDIADEWETMVFGGVFDGWQDRCTTRTAARITHTAIVFAIRCGIQLRDADRARRRRMHAAYRARRA